MEEIKPRTERIMEALRDGESKTRAQILAAIGGGPTSKLQDALTRLVAEQRITRIRMGLYRLAA